MLMWLHTDMVVLDELLAVWVDSLNDFVASAISEVGDYVYNVCWLWVWVGLVMLWNLKLGYLKF